MTVVPPIFRPNGRAFEKGELCNSIHEKGGANAAQMMNADEIEALADSWLAHFASSESAEDVANSLAFGTLYDLCSDAPDVAWAVTEAMLARALTPHLKSVVAGGPIEQLLADHGEEIIERIERRAKTDAEFKTLLGGVWKNRMTDEIWSRVQAIAGRLGEEAARTSGKAVSYEIGPTAFRSKTGAF